MCLFTGSKVALLVEEAILASTLRKDVRQLAPGIGTATLESFHSRLNKFAPKAYSYSYTSLLCR